MPTTLVRNGVVVTAADRFEADLYLDNGRIALIGPGLNLPADETVDASGLLVMPGAVDVHTHLDMPAGGLVSSDDFESGTVAAAFGGTTTIVDFATQERGQSLMDALRIWRAKAEGRAAVDFGFHMAICDWSDRTASEMEALVDQEGVPSFKLYMAYKGRLQVDDGVVFQALACSRAIGGLVCVHAENGDVVDALTREALAAGRTTPRQHADARPRRAEAEAVGRAAALAEIAGAALYVVHVSCAEGVEELSRARRRGVRVHAETCPQYLVLGEEEYERPGPESVRVIAAPPLRSEADREALWRALRDGEIDVVSTDHCPFTAEEKAAGGDDFSRVPNGLPGIETRLMLLWDAGVRTGRLDAHRFVDLVATRPARLFGLWPRKGTIGIGSDADLVLFDPEAERSLDAAALHMRVDWSPYEGRRVRGAPAVVISRGEVIVDHGDFKGRPGHGRYLPRSPKPRRPGPPDR
jgi:dihydropyrimidinase